MTNPGAVSGAAPSRLAHIQAPVERRIDEVLGELRRMVISDFGMIEEVNEYLLLMRGKLFRPTLLLLANEVGGRPSEEAVRVAAVVELIHLATLVHDDAVDHSALRRGQPTVNAHWTPQVAVIMGDYFYSRAVTELAKVGSLDAVGVLARAANAMSIGEMRQLTSYDTLEFSQDDYYRLIAAKTASLMAAACELGSLVGDDRYREPLARFGHNLGMAFQIADDLLDYTGIEAVTGKPTGHDLRERKVTLPLVGALRDATDAETDEIRRFFSRVDPTEDEIEHIIDIVQRRGGLDYARNRAAEFAELAEEALTGLPNSEALDCLAGAVGYAIGRSR
jgi:octaprenyl-diphosphate synthase